MARAAHRMMSLAERWAETIYQIATTRNKLKIILTPVGLVFWFGLSGLFVFASLWLDSRLLVQLPFLAIVNIGLSLALLLIGGILCLWSIYSFSKAQGSPGEAIANFDQAIVLDPQCADAYLNRCYALAAQGDLSRGIPDFQKFMELTEDPWLRKLAEETLRLLGSG